MVIIQYIFGALGAVALIPSFLLFPAIIILGIVGFIKKDFNLLKKYLKIWGYSLLVLMGILILYGVASFIVTISK